MPPLRRFPAVVLLALSAVLAPLACDESLKPSGGTTPDPIAHNQDELIQLLARAYTTRNCDLFESLFPAPEDSVDYAYFLDRQIQGTTNWDLPEELRIHHRMFQCDSLPPAGLSYDLWLTNITIVLTRTADSWGERPDLYRSEANPNGLDPAKWSATEAEFNADVLLDTQSDTDYRVADRVNFVVLENLRKSAGAAHKFLIYRWEDLGSVEQKLASVTPASWSTVKSLYR